MSGPPDAAAAAVAGIVSRLARPYDAPSALAAMTGLRPRAAAAVLGAELATSAAAETLLDSMAHTIRSLAIATTDTPRRCYGELRGPVLWAETVASRSASAGDTGLFVCASPARAFDTDENRTLVAALDVVRAGAESAGAAGGVVAGPPPDLVRRARHNAGRALRYLEHRSLVDLPRRRPSGRALRRTSAGHRRATYAPATAMLVQAANPLDAATVATRADLASEQVILFAQGLARLPAVPVRAGGGRLRAGPMEMQPGRDATVSVLVAGEVVGDPGALARALADEST